VTRILSLLKSDILKISDKDDAEWLNSTNKIIQEYNLGISNVKELLLEIVFSNY
jgi:hypothetical protein